MVATKTRRDERNDSLLDTPLRDLKALRCAALYGANASGKSNVLRAMRVFSRMVSKSQRQWNPMGGVPTWDPFALDGVSRNAETEFQIDFVLRQRVYNYGFRFNQTIFVDEWLKDITKREKQIFCRKTISRPTSTSFEDQLSSLAAQQNGQNATEDSNVSVDFPGRNLGATSEDSKHLDAITLQTRPNSLFLSSAAQSNHEFLSNIFKGIVEHFQIISTSFGQPWRLRTADICAAEGRKEQIKAFLAFADFDIVDVEVTDKEIPANLKGLLDQTEGLLKEIEQESVMTTNSMNSSSRFHKIKMVHSVTGDQSYLLDFDEESAGTRAYFYMLGPILDVLRDGTLLLIDELESSLHPHLARQFVRIFNDPALNPKGAQLIFATHDTNLLDLNLLRRDQIWLTEKNDEGATVLIPLSDYKVRTDQKIASAYLHGRFGAIPFLDEKWLRAALELPTDKPTASVSKDEAR